MQKKLLHLVALDHLLNELSMLSGENTDTPAEKKPWDTTKKVGEEYSMSRNSVARLIRINKLVPELKAAVDTGELSVRAGVELSYLNEETQVHISEFLDVAKIDIKKAAAIRNHADDNGNVKSPDLIRIIVGEPKMPKPKSYKISGERIGRFFKEDMTNAEIEDTVEKALELYFASEERNK